MYQWLLYRQYTSYTIQTKFSLCTMRVVVGLAVNLLLNLESLVRTKVAM